MTKLRNMKAAVALGSLTAAVALLTGLPAASAQTAPGGGSFPGSFLVPGTNTSLAIHGIIWFDAVHDFGPHQGSTTASVQGVPVTGRSLNGGTSFEVKPTRPNIETRTPTAYGELKTYIEFDMNEFKNQTGSVGQGNAEGFRLRQAYGTLGPLLVGQANSLFIDPQSWPESIDATIDPGTMNTATDRQPQIRYTYLAGNGLTIAGALQQNESTLLTGTATTAASLSSDNNSVITNLPDLVGAAILSQPWGDVGLHAALHRNEIRSLAINPATGTAYDQKKTGFAVSVAGHLNTVGKDAFRGGATYADGASTYISFASPSVILNPTTGATSTQKAYGFWGGYTHFWASNLRSTIHGGYTHFDKPSAALTTQLPSIEKRWWAAHANIFWSPVPQTDFGIEYVYWNREVQSGAKGTDQRVDLQMKFYF